jgi:hypothetical protein
MVGHRSATSDSILQYLITRIHQDVRFIVELGHLNPQDADAFLSHLPLDDEMSVAGTIASSEVSTHTAFSNTVSTPSANSSTSTVSSAVPRVPIAQARSLWPYNERGTVSIAGAD